jgi:hypothetical protein
MYLGVSPVTPVSVHRAPVSRIIVILNPGNADRPIGAVGTDAQARSALQE